MLETPRLVLRPMRLGDATDLLGAFGDAEVMAAFDAAPFGREDMERWVHRNLAHQHEHGYGLFTVVARDTGDVIGDCGLEWTDVRGAPTAELGYDLRRDLWGRGLATEAATAVRDLAFGTLRLNRVVSLVRQGNHASRRVAEKVGMRHVDDVPGDAYDYWLYAVEAPDGR